MLGVSVITTNRAGLFYPFNGLAVHAALLDMLMRIIGRICDTVERVESTTHVCFTAQEELVPNSKCDSHGQRVDLHTSVAEDTGSHQTSYGGDSRRASSPGRMYVYLEPL